LGRDGRRENLALRLGGLLQFINPFSLALDGVSELFDGLNELFDGATVRSVGYCGHGWLTKPRLSTWANYMPCRPERTSVQLGPSRPFFDSVALRIVSHAANLKPSDSAMSFVRRLADVLLSEYGCIQPAMKNITVRLDESLIADLEEEADEHGVSRSEYIRNTLATRHEHDGEHEEYEERIAALEREIADLEQENDRLKREKRLILEQREENTELIEYVQEERTLERRRAEAGILTRTKWWFTGMPADGE
jgi:hypothetical protein